MPTWEENQKNDRLYIYGWTAILFRISAMIREQVIHWLTNESRIFLKSSQSIIMRSIDVLCHQLGIQHPMIYLTCVCQGDNDLACGHPVAGYAREEATDVLFEMARWLTGPFDEPEDAELRTLAELLLSQYCQVKVQQVSQIWTANFIDSLPESQRHDRLVPTPQNRLVPCPDRQQKLVHDTSPLTTNSLPSRMPLVIATSSEVLLEGATSPAMTLSAISPPGTAYFTPLSGTTTRVAFPDDTPESGLVQSSKKQFIADFRSKLHASMDFVFIVDVLHVLCEYIDKIHVLGFVDIEPHSESNSTVEMDLPSTGDTGITKPTPHTSLPTVASPVGNITPNIASSIDRSERTINATVASALTPVTILPVVRSLSGLDRASIVQLLCSTCQQPYTEGKDDFGKCQLCLNKAYMDNFPQWQRDRDTSMPAPFS